jgi:Tfp pilus assembly protein PilZ
MKDRPKDPPTERRKFSRVLVAMKIEVTSGKQTVISSVLKNISMGGLFILTEEKLPLEAECRITIFLEEPEPKPRIEARGKVVRVTDEGLAIHLQELLGPESYTHLKNLILYNAPDTEKFEKQIEAHLGIKSSKGDPPSEGG